MKLCRFNGDRIGLVRGGGVHDVTEVLGKLEKLTYPYPLGDQLITHLEDLRSDLEKAADKTTAVAASEVKFNAPVANPSKIMGVPSNYLKHVQEADDDEEISQYSKLKFEGRKKKLGEQGIFLKANSALIGVSEGIDLRFSNRRTDHELELGVIIGKKASRVAEVNALEYISGYTIALDIVVRGPEDRSFRKSCDSFAVLGPWLVTTDEIEDPNNLEISLSIDGCVRQSANTNEMIFNIQKQISWASQFYTLLPGDVLMTGTCEGVGPIKSGEVLHVNVENIGSADIQIN